MKQWTDRDLARGLPALGLVRQVTWRHQQAQQQGAVGPIVLVVANWKTPGVKLTLCNLSLYHPSDIFHPITFKTLLFQPLGRQADNVDGMNTSSFSSYLLTIIPGKIFTYSNNQMSNPQMMFKVFCSLEVISGKCTNTRELFRGKNI